MTQTITYSAVPLKCASENGAIFAQAFVPQTEGKLPVVIMSHGYNCTLESVLDYAEGLAAHGFITVAFDFCGGSLRSKSEGSSLQMSLKTEVADLMAVVAAAKEIPAADENRIYLYGESQGGCVSALAAGEHPELFAGIVLMYPALCIPDDWRRITADGTPDTFEIFGMTLSRKFADEIPREDIYSLISRFEKPVLILQGDRDDIVDISYSERAQKAYKNAQLAVYSGEGHGFSPRVRAVALARMHNFFTEQK